MLVVRRGGLGDTLLLLPVLRALRRAHPGAALHFAGVHEFARVLLQHGAVDEVFSSEDLAPWTLAGPRGDVARERLRGYALVVADDPLLAALADAGTRVQLLDLVVREREPFGLQLAQRLGLSPVWPDDAWFVPPRSVPFAGPVVLAPGSGGRAKCWPKERWLELAPLLAPSGASIEVVVGPVESERDDPRCWPWPVPVDFLADLTPVGLGERLRAAAAFVGNDSGTTHLAAMLGVPTVAVFGPTDPRVWAPVGDHVQVLDAGPAMDRLAATVVAAAVRQGSCPRTRRQ